MELTRQTWLRKWPLVWPARQCSRSIVQIDEWTVSWRNKSWWRKVVGQLLDLWFMRKKMTGEVSSHVVDYLGKNRLEVSWRAITEGQEGMRSPEKWLREQSEENARKERTPEFQGIWISRNVESWRAGEWRLRSIWSKNGFSIEQKWWVPWCFYTAPSLLQEPKFYCLKTYGAN